LLSHFYPSLGHNLETEILSQMEWFKQKRAHVCEVLFMNHDDPEAKDQQNLMLYNE